MTGLAAAGWSLVEGVLGAAERRAALDAAERLLEPDGRRRAGVRHVLVRSEALRTLANSHSVRALVEPVLGPAAFVVRAIVFDKRPGANWDVPWHQDVTIAVEARADVAGFGPWSTKDGVPHVQPPASVLEQMRTVRLHLDDCGPENGALRVVPGSHRLGVLGDVVDVADAERRHVVCAARAGDAVLMRPLLLHASRKSRVVAHRRVLHLELAAAALPAPLEWARA